MAQGNAAMAANDEQGEQGRSFSKKPPTILYDNGHGTRVKKWDEGVASIQIERSYKPKGSEDYVTQAINLTAEEALGVIFGLQKGVEQAMEKVSAKSQTRA